MRRVFLFAMVLALTSLRGLAAGPADLIDAVQSGNTAAAIKLIEAKVDVNSTSADGTTALHWAVHNADAGMVDRLIKGGQHLKYPDQTPLSNLLLTVAQRAGVETDKVGDDGIKPLSEI